MPIAPSSVSRGLAWLEEPIEEVGRTGFARALLRTLAATLSADHCAAFQSSFRRRTMACLLVDSRSDRESALRSAQSYANAYWRHDRVIAALPRTSGIHIVHQTWDAVPYAPMREQCYRLTGVVDRLSIIRQRPDTTLIVSVFRCRQTGFFRNADEDRLRDMASVLAALVSRHAGLEGIGEEVVTLNGLSRREWDVATRLARGGTVAQTAASLSLSPHSVETYRRRVYAKLHVHNRIELLARLADIRGAFTLRDRRLTA